ncbi:MAG TPA: alpha-1,4-glucan--maltose-1-phosphate maltosyltransferase [Gaiellaceae bacterium]|nr:alpha-1,4-glucan--maltose-1-phosphate maltosyltransferase [Gaiellaceae bacterium]
MPLPRTSEPPRRIQIQAIEPLVDGGRHPVKRSQGERVGLSATIFRDGHEILGAAVRARPKGERRWRETLMYHAGNDRWVGHLEPDRCGLWEVALSAWVDRFASWRHELQRKVDAGQEDLSGELSEGAALFGVESLRVEEALANAESDRSEVTTSPTLLVDVDRERARFGAWYELFPRSWGGFRGVTEALPRLAELGFDVVYLPPVHPIGRTNRKGRNNALAAGPDDPGSPWAIGSEEGGHDAVDPGLGTLADFERMVETGREVGCEVCLDFAIQCSPDHPWLKEHPEWFHRRPDGTLKYAENPPKRYQDIYNVDFACEDWKGLWQALHDVVRTWVDRGVKVFRVDNPHTKPVPFWEWLIREIRGRDPDVVFLAEAFTRPAMMQTLGKIGFGQSYTYFTWKNAKWELEEFVGDLLAWRDHYRPNFFANTPDILHRYLQQGGRPAFEARLVLAATLSPSYGIYSGYEHCENTPLREGSEEYLDSEKYEVKARSLNGPLLPLARRLNEARRAHPALRWLELAWLETESDDLLAYAKKQGDDVVLTVVNLNPFEEREGVTVLPAWLGLPPAVPVRDLLRDEVFTWHIGRNYVRLGPGQAHVLAPERA